MTKRSHLLIGSVLIVFGVLLSGCEFGDSNSVAPTETLSPERPGVTIRGKLTSAGSMYYIQEAGKTTEVVSKKIDLKPKVGMDVELYGEFSGNTLYVDEVR